MSNRGGTNQGESTPRGRHRSAGRQPPTVPPNPRVGSQHNTPETKQGLSARHTAAQLRQLHRQIDLYSKRYTRDGKPKDAWQLLRLREELHKLEEDLNQPS